MTKKDLISKLIKHYQKCIKKIEDKKGLRDIYEILEEFKTEIGICHCSKLIFNTFIYDEAWVCKYEISDSGKWGEAPSLAITKEEVIRRLDVRITNLKKELECT